MARTTARTIPGRVAWFAGGAGVEARMEDPMKLYHNPLSPNGRKPRLVAAHLGLEIEEEIVDFGKGAHKSPEFLKLNPNGKVPVLVDGDTVLWESNAIMAYLAGRTDNTLWPRSDARYDILRWMFWEQAHWATATNILVGEHIFAPMRGAEPDPARVEKGNAETKRFAAVLDGQLASRDWLCGDTVTIADLAIAPSLSLRVPAKLPLDDFKHLGAWFERVQALDAWKKTA